jgi:AcrR family transcriptional regulator
MPRTATQFNEMREKSREKIMRSAMKLFSTQGFHATSMQAIAKAAGVAAGLVYNYYPSKDALLAAIVKNALVEIEGVFAAQAQVRGDGDGLIQLMDALFETVKRRRNAWKLLVHIILQPQAATPGLQGIGRVWGLFLATAERQFKKRGEKHPEKQARALTALLHGVVLTHIFQEDEGELELVKGVLIEKFKLT